MDNLEQRHQRELRDDFIEINKDHYRTLHAVAVDADIDWHPESDYEEGDIVHFSFFGHPDENHGDEFYQENAGRGWFRIEQETEDGEPQLLRSKNTKEECTLFKMCL